MSDKILEEFIARLEQAATNYQIHKSDVWLKELSKSKDKIRKYFEKSCYEFYIQGKSDQEWDNLNSGIE